MVPGPLGNEIRDFNPSVCTSNLNKASYKNTVSQDVAQHPVHRVTWSHSIVRVHLYVTRWDSIATYRLRDSLIGRVQAEETSHSAPPNHMQGHSISTPGTRIVTACKKTLESYGDITTHHTIKLHSKMVLCVCTHTDTHTHSNSVHSS